MSDPAPKDPNPEKLPESPRLVPIYAAVDIGSHNVRIDLYGLNSEGKVEKVEINETTSVPCKLAQDMSEDHLVIKRGNLNDAKMAMRSFDVIIKNFDIRPENVCAIMTEAVRAVELTEQGREDIRVLIQAFGGRECKIATKEEEAHLVGEAVKIGINGWNIVHGKKIEIAFSAVGGGSIEAGVLTVDDEIKDTVTLPLGVHRLIKDSGGSIPKAGERVEDMLDDYYKHHRHKVLAVIGGNWRALGQALCGKVPASLEGSAIRQNLISATQRKPKYFAAMQKQIARRAAFLPVAAAILRRISKHFHAEKIVFLNTTVRDAMAEMMRRRDNHQPIPPGLQRLFSPSAPAPILPA